MEYLSPSKGNLRWYTSAIEAEQMRYAHAFREAGGNEQRIRAAREVFDSALRSICAIRDQRLKEKMRQQEVVKLAAIVLLVLSIWRALRG